MGKINHGNIHEKSRVRLNTQKEHWQYSRSSIETRRKWSSHGREGSEDGITEVTGG